MQKDFNLEEIKQFYPDHMVVETDSHFLIKDYFDFVEFKLSAKIRKNLPVFQNGNPLLPTHPFDVTDTEISVAIGTSTDGLRAQVWFGEFHAADQTTPYAYFGFGDPAQAKVFLAIVYWDQNQNWYRTGIDAELKTARKAIKFIKCRQPELGTGQDVWINPIQNGACALWRNYINQKEIITHNSMISLNKTTSFPKTPTVTTDVSA